MATRGKAIAAGVSLLAASLSLILSYVVCDWLLIRYWEWRHEGRRMVFTFWADLPAIALAVLVCVIVLCLTFRLVQSRSKEVPGGRVAPGSFTPRPSQIRT